jgi:tRNA pseudouridine38-40 synthase
LRTVAGELETALSRLFLQPVKVTCAGRTDTGVHAVGQVISFRAHDRFPIERLAIAMNANLPDDLTARDTQRADDVFSARFSARERHYVYLVLNRESPSAPLRRFVHHEYRSLDDAAMGAALTLLQGTHDFASFCGVPPENGVTVRTLREAAVERDGALLRFDLRADGFLHRMCRVIVGTVLDVGAGRRAPESIGAMLKARDRREAGLTAPPCGLYFAGVRYDDFDSHPADLALMRDRIG